MATSVTRNKRRAMLLRFLPRTTEEEEVDDLLKRYGKRTAELAEMVRLYYGFGPDDPLKNRQMAEHFKCSLGTAARKRKIGLIRFKRWIETYRESA